MMTTSFAFGFVNNLLLQKPNFNSSNITYNSKWLYCHLKVKVIALTQVNLWWNICIRHDHIARQWPIYSSSLLNHYYIDSQLISVQQHRNSMRMIQLLNTDDYFHIYMSHELQFLYLWLKCLYICRYFYICDPQIYKQLCVFLHLLVFLYLWVLQSPLWRNPLCYFWHPLNCWKISNRVGR